MNESESTQQLVQLISSGAKNAEAADILNIFKIIKIMAQKVAYLKRDNAKKDYSCQINLVDVEKSYWITVSQGMIEFGEGAFDNPTTTLLSSNETVLGMFFGEIDANIVGDLGKIGATGNLIDLRSFQELFEDSMMEFRKLFNIPLPSDGIPSESSLSEIQTRFLASLQDVENLVSTDPILKKDMQDYHLKVQWDILGVRGYQIFDNGSYSYQMDSVLSDPDLRLEFLNLESALQFLRGEIDEYSYKYFERKFKLYYIDHLEEIEKEGHKILLKHRRHLLTAHYTQNVVFHPFVLSKIPIFRKIIKRLYVPEQSGGSYIPINTSLGSYDNQILPEKLIRHFIDKASAIYISADCGCRAYHNCQSHDAKIGCMYLGSDVKNIKFPPYRGHLATHEEAIEHMQKALKSGLVPTFGRYVFESNSIGVEDTGHFMSMCFCCDCCCINGKMMQNATNELHGVFQRMEGLNLEVDPEKCIGCGECIDICIFNGNRLVDGKAEIIQEVCLGCGRCESVCPNDAISITLDDPSRIEDFIKRIEDQVDVS